MRELSNRALHYFFRRFHTYSIDRAFQDKSLEFRYLRRDQCLRLCYVFRFRFRFYGFISVFSKRSLSSSGSIIVFGSLRDEAPFNMF